MKKKIKLLKRLRKLTRKKEENKRENKSKHITIKTVPKKTMSNALPNASQDNKNIFEKYQLDVDKAKVTVTIEKKEGGFYYNLSIPKIDIGTTALLDEVRKDLVAVTSIEVGELVDEKSVSKIK